MSLSEVKLKAVPILKRYGVRRAGVFGSVARGQARRDSDVDIVVSMPAHADLLDFVSLKRALEERLQRNVDLATYQSILPSIKKQVAKEQVRLL